MRDYLLIFRHSGNPHANPSPEQMQERMQWLADITAQQKLSDKGNRLSISSACTVQPGNVVTDGPYKENGASISGYMIVQAASIAEAVELAKNNPIFKTGGNIEVRGVLTPEYPV